MKTQILKLLFFLLTAIGSFNVAFSQNPFITTWKTDNPGESGPTSITIPTFGPNYNYDIDWENDGIYDELGVTGSATHDYGSPGTYQVAIRGNFPQIYFNNSGDKDKILSIDQWGAIAWRSMLSSFLGCSNLQILADDAPDLSQVTSFVQMFDRCTSLNADLSNWDVSNINFMAAMFRGAVQFNGDISSWNVSNVVNMLDMFSGAAQFNGDLSSWDVSKC